MSLLDFVVQNTAHGLVRGRVFMASKGAYTIIGSRERQGFSVMLMRGADTIYREEHRHPALTAMKMVEVWHTLRLKLDGPGTTSPYNRISGGPPST